MNDNYINFAKERNNWITTLEEIGKENIKQTIDKAFIKINALRFREDIYAYTS